MKEKEWKKEQKIPLLPVEFPEDSVMQKECRAIVEKAIPKRQSLWERIKEIYWGPGIRAIFYQSGSIWLIVACLYLGIGWLGQSYAKQPETQMIIVFLGFPVCFLVFAALAWWLDAQNHMQDLIGSFHYSQSYLSGLRMLYAGVIMILVNVTGAALFTDISGKAFVSMVLVGSSIVCLGLCICLSQRSGRPVLRSFDRSLGVCVRNCKACGNWRADVSFYIGSAGGARRGHCRKFLSFVHINRKGGEKRCLLFRMLAKVTENFRRWKTSVLRWSMGFTECLPQTVRERQLS